MTADGFPRLADPVPGAGLDDCTIVIRFSSGLRAEVVGANRPHGGAAFTTLAGAIGVGRFRAAVERALVVLKEEVDAEKLAAHKAAQRPRRAG